MKKVTTSATNVLAAKTAVTEASKGTPFSLNMLTYATVTPTDRSAKPSAAVRQGGQIVFNAAANKIVGFPEKQFFMVGNNPQAAEPSETLYLVPAKSDEKNVIKATKNNDGFQFRQDNVLAALGVKQKDRYSVAEAKDGEVIYYVLTKMTKAETEAADAAEAGK